MDNLNAPALEELVRRIEKLERGAPVGFSSVSRGALRITSAEGLIVQGSAKVSGTLAVTGTENVTGTLNVSGTLNADGTISLKGPVTISGATSITGNVTATGTTALNGPVNIAGATKVTGVTRLEGDTTQVGAHHVQGNQDITGTLAVKGAATLENNLTLSGTSAKIIAGVVSLDNNGTLRSTNALLIVAVGLTTVQNDFYVVGNMTGAGTFANTGISNTTSAANVHMNSTSKQIYFSTSARRYKIDPRPMNLPDSILAVPVQDWVDLGSAERFAILNYAPRPLSESDQIEFDGLSLVRVPGIIAEDVEAAGGRSFVTYDENGLVQGVSYDRLALARTEILARQLADVRAELAEVRKLLS